MKLLVRTILILSVGFILFSGWFIYELITDEPPNFFPLQDISAEYRISKLCPDGQGNVEKAEGGSVYCLEYRGEHANQIVQRDTKFFRITIGKSEKELSSFTNKEIRNIKGKYSSSSRQCILDKCVDIGGPFVVVDLYDFD